VQVHLTCAPTYIHICMFLLNMSALPSGCGPVFSPLFKLTAKSITHRMATLIAHSSQGLNACNNSNVTSAHAPAQQTL
jgi:hypothetical protein